MQIEAVLKGLSILSQYADEVTPYYVPNTFPLSGAPDHPSRLYLSVEMNGDIPHQEAVVLQEFGWRCECDGMYWVLENTPGPRPSLTPKLRTCQVRLEKLSGAACLRITEVPERVQDQEVYDMFQQVAFPFEAEVVTEDPGVPSPNVQTISFTALMREHGLAL